MRCVVEMFGLPQEITKLRQVEVELKDKAGLRDLIAALRRKIPTLEGHAIHAGEDRLRQYYAFNVNGYFYSDDSELQLQDGDRVGLLLLASGG